MITSAGDDGVSPVCGPFRAIFTLRRVVQVLDAERSVGAFDLRVGSESCGESGVVCPSVDPFRVPGIGLVLSSPGDIGTSRRDIGRDRFICRKGTGGSAGIRRERFDFGHAEGVAHPVNEAGRLGRAVGAECAVASITINGIEDKKRSQIDRIIEGVVLGIAGRVQSLSHFVIAGADENVHAHGLDSVGVSRNCLIVVLGEIDQVVDISPVHEGEDSRLEGPLTSVPRSDTKSRREDVVDIEVIVECESELLHVVSALRSSGGFPCLRNGWEQESDEDCNDGDNDQEFD